MGTTVAIQAYGSSCWEEDKKLDGLDIYCPLVNGSVGVPNFWQSSCLERRKDAEQKACQNCKNWED